MTLRGPRRQRPASTSARPPTDADRAVEDGDRRGSDARRRSAARRQLVEHRRVLRDRCPRRAATSRSAGAASARRSPRRPRPSRRAGEASTWLMPTPARCRRPLGRCTERWRHGLLAVDRARHASVGPATRSALHRPGAVRRRGQRRACRAHRAQRPARHPGRRLVRASTATRRVVPARSRRRRRRSPAVDERIPDGAASRPASASIPDGVLGAAGGHRDLGVHTELLSDGAIDLVEQASSTGVRKVRRPSEVVDDVRASARGGLRLPRREPAVELAAGRLGRRPAHHRPGAATSCRSTPPSRSTCGHAASATDGLASLAGSSGRPSFAPERHAARRGRAPRRPSRSRRGEPHRPGARSEVAGHDPRGIADVRSPSTS